MHPQGLCLTWSPVPCNSPKRLLHTQAWLDACLVFARNTLWMALFFYQAAPPRFGAAPALVRSPLWGRIRKGGASGLRRGSCMREVRRDSRPPSLTVWGRVSGPFDSGAPSTSVRCFTCAVSLVMPPLQGRKLRCRGGDLPTGKGVT